MIVVYYNKNSYKRTLLEGGELLFCVRGTTGIMSFAADELKGYSVMVQGNYDLENYTKFDITNVIWYYGGLYK